MIFEEFHKKFKASNCRKVPIESIQKFEQKLPASLIQLWKEDGWCSYGQGLMCFVNPDDYENVLSELLENGENFIIFARGGFGDLFSWNGKAIYQLFVHTGINGRIMKDIEVYMMTSMVHDPFLEDSHYLSLFKQAVVKHGELLPNECFAFVPALALGGEFSVKNVQKVSHIEQLLFLSQIYGKIKNR